MEIIRLNNQAATLLSHGKQEEAALCLQGALTKLRDAVNTMDVLEHQNQQSTDIVTSGANVAGKDDPTEVCSCRHYTRYQEQHRQQCNPWLTIESLAGTNGDMETAEPIVNNTFEFYDKVFLVSLNEDIRSEVGCPQCLQIEHVHNLLLAVITYNLGSVSQHLALKYGRSLQFAKAMNFYDLSFSTIENILQDYGFDGNLILLLCGLYNNMGYIHARSHDIEETRFCLEWLQRTVFAEEFFFAPMTDDDYSFFSLYLAIRSDEQFQIAAAA